ncbi:MAG: triose-phosphate isomerase [Desulfomonilaceae bacterium]|nr:triose-phosphate isomerase [Desulfomonilaceae bacterium]
MAARRPIIAGNWKMHKTPEEAKELVTAIAAGMAGKSFGCEVVVAPPFTSITSAVAAAAGTPIGVAGQNVYWEDEGAFTGEISGGMLKSAGCSFVIIGHSERRQYFGETNETVRRRIEAAVRWNLVPIFCLGETLEEREAGETFNVIRSELTEGLRGVRPDDPLRFVIAYEPVWAIGTGRTASPEQAQEVHAFLRREIGGLLGEGFAERMRILYGGSVKASNAKALMACEDIDGGLVGGASLNAEDFLGIIREGS